MTRRDRCQSRTRARPSPTKIRRLKHATPRTFCCTCLPRSGTCRSQNQDIQAKGFHLLTYREVSGKSFKYRSNVERQAQINILYHFSATRETRPNCSKKHKYKSFGRKGSEKKIHLVMKGDKYDRRPIFCTVAQPRRLVS